MTWPLAPGIARDVPGDLGDALLNMWILGWGAENIPRLLTGQISLNDFWHANIFHPEPLALSFSEHLFGLSIQILPIYWLTKNLILSYNLLFISSFVLSGLGMYLLARDLLTDVDRRPPADDWRPAAAFVAGLIFAFVPFRIAQVAHIQSLHAQWMPLALYGLRRYTRTGNWRTLAGASGALLMQNWSNGYYAIYFAPFVPLWVVHHLWTAARLRDVRMWASLAGAGTLVAAGTLPFLWLYLKAQGVHGFERSLGEVIAFSADVYSYFTAPETLRVWGSVMQAFPKPEGELFLGIVTYTLAAIAIVSPLIRSGDALGPGEVRTAVAHAGASALRTHLARVVLAIIAIQSIGLLAMILTGGFVTSFAGLPIRATNPARLATTIAISFGVLLSISPRARDRTRMTLRSPVFLCATFAVLAVWLSLGPVPRSYGRELRGLGLYRVFYDHVPGFEGLRVPARYAMIAAVFLAPLAAFGSAALIRATRHTAVAMVIAAAFIIEAAFVPMPLNLTWGARRDGPSPPAQVEPHADAPAVYHHLATMPGDMIVAEFPFGDSEWELRYVYYSTVHWKRILNGYSGGFPQGYTQRVALLQRVGERPDEAWRALRDAGTTHVIVHERAFAAADADVVKTWLTDHFAVEIARFEGDLLFEVSFANAR